MSNGLSSESGGKKKDSITVVVVTIIITVIKALLWSTRDHQVVHTKDIWSVVHTVTNIAERIYSFFFIPSAYFCVFIRLFLLLFLFSLSSFLLFNPESDHNDSRSGKAQMFQLSLSKSNEEDGSTRAVTQHPGAANESLEPKLWY